MVVGRGRVISWFRRTVRDVEAEINAEDEVEMDDNNLDGEIEDVEARFGLIAGWMVPWSGLFVVGSHAVEGAETEENSGQQENDDLASETTGTKLIHSCPARDHDAQDDHDDGQQGDEGVEGLAVELQVPVDALGVVAESVKRLDRGGDEYDQCDDDEGVYRNEKRAGRLVPSEMGVACSDDAFGKDDIDDKEQDDAGRNEDVGSNGQRDVHRMIGPCDAQDTSDSPRRAEAE